MCENGFGEQNVAGVLRLDCHHCTICIGHSLLCEMTVISLLPNLAESISPAIREEGGKEEEEDGGGKKVRPGRKEGWEGQDGEKGLRGCSCLSSAYHLRHNMFLWVTEPFRPSGTRAHLHTHTYTHTHK